ncbi:MAG: type II secretion system GspH family protein, partial [Phycisphaerae bacterium]|nr:type II secretion system GspH family protein [Phycisphaerae bacterium]
MPTRRAFTLVELLVVIGIIALLVSILLPALGNARSAAETVKCAAGLREIGNTFRMYALDSRGWFPPSQLQPASGRTYIVDGVSYPTSDGLGAYWFTYLARYATKSKIGSQTSIGSEMADARRSIFWGCPAWLGYYQSSINDTNRNQLGFGMSWWPTFSATNPRIGQFPNVSERSFI